MKIEVIKNGEVVHTYNQSVEALVPSRHDQIIIDGVQYNVVARSVMTEIDENKRSRHKVLLYV